MTREDAIKSLLQIDCPENIRVEAESVLIQIALQEPCEDTISREAAIKEAFQIEVDGSSVEVVQVETLMALPSLSSWISVKDRLPDTNDEVLISTVRKEVLYGFFNKYNGKWFIYEWNYYMSGEFATAWQDLPSPYVPDTKIGEMEE